MPACPGLPMIVRAVAATVLLWFTLAAVAQAATFVVDSTADALDADPGDGVCATLAATCTLRAAIQEANHLPGADAVGVPAGTYVLTINGRNENGALTGDLDINAALTLSGAGPATIIDGGGVDRVFEVRGGPVTITGVTIRGGVVPECGGGIRNESDLGVTNVELTANQAGWGGGVCNDALDGDTTTLTLTDVTVQGNTATQYGGGIATEAAPYFDFPQILFPGHATTTLTNVVVADNVAPNGGGIGVRTVINAVATVMATATTVRDNVADGGFGGGVAVVGTGEFAIFPSLSEFHAVDSTISGNTALTGGGISGNLFSLVRSSVSDNEATGIGGGLVGVGSIEDSTISGNRSGGDGGGLYASNDESFHLKGVTITANVADADNDGNGDGGGIRMAGTPIENFEFPRVALENTIVAGNTDNGGEGPDCSGECAPPGTT